jgi:DNA-binding SARP family transcriptional activator
MDRTRPETPHLRVYLLGRQRLVFEERELRPLGGKLLSLFAYLLLNAEVDHAREQLVERFWPESTPARGRRNLSDTLYRLRELVPGDWLVAGTAAIRLKRTGRLWVDVWAFQAACRSDDPAQQREAANLYAGDLLAELYDDWVVPYRNELRECYVAQALALGEALETGGQLDAAALCYRRILQADPLDERAHCGIIRTLARVGRLGDALERYDALVDLLERELGVPPAQESRLLAERLFGELELQRRQKPAEALHSLRPRFAGRVEERSALLAAVERAMGGNGGLIALGGPSGIGKTRLMEEIAAGAEWRGMQVVWGRSTAKPGASAYDPLQEALQAALAGPRAAQLETMLPAEVLASVAPLYAAWHHDIALPALPPAAAWQRFVTSTGELWNALAAVRPLLCILDDVHWAARSFWRLLDALLPAMSRGRLLLLLAYRQPEIEEQAAWEYILRWERSGQLQAFKLGPLAIAEVAQLLPGDCTEEAAALWAQSGGSPYYLVQALATPHGSTQPATLAERLARLPPDAHAALEVAAVLGRNVPYRLWAATAALPAPVLVEVAEQLAHDLILLPQEGGYRFVHDIVHEAVYGGMPQGRRSALHGQVAQVLAGLAPAERRDRAYHLAQAGRSEEAGYLYRELSREAAAQFAFGEALDALEGALRNGDELHAGARAELLTEAARLYDIVGDVARRRAAAEAALALADLAGSPELRLAAGVHLADAAAKTGEHAIAAEGFAAAQPLAELLGDRSQSLDILLMWADLDARIGENSAAAARFQQAADLAGTLGDAVRQGRALEGLGWVEAAQGIAEMQVIARMDEALQVHLASGDRFEIARTQLSLFSALQAAGRWDRFLEMEAAVVADLRSVQYRRGEAAALQAICWVRSALGDLTAARAAAEEALRLFDAIGDRLGVSISVASLGQLAQEQDDPAAALRYFDRALASVLEVGSAVHEAFARQDLGGLLVQTGDYAAALPHLQQAQAGWLRSGERLNRLHCETLLAIAGTHLAMEEAAAAWTEDCWEAFLEGQEAGSELLKWYADLARLLILRRRPDDAARVNEAAYGELLRQAGTLPSDDLQRRFLRQPRVNREIAAAYLQQQPEPAQRRVSLARTGAPLGRTLSPSDLVEITWTLRAAEDDLLTDGATRRRHVLQRLVAEATAQGAAPTDDDLSAALGVSRRTVLRDMVVLAAAGVLPVTRARA